MVCITILLMNHFSRSSNNRLAFKSALRLKCVINLNNCTKGIKNESTESQNTLGVYCAVPIWLDCWIVYISAFAALNRCWCLLKYLNVYHGIILLERVICRAKEATTSVVVLRKCKGTFCTEIRHVPPLRHADNSQTTSSLTHPLDRVNTSTIYDPDAPCTLELQWERKRGAAAAAGA